MSEIKSDWDEVRAELRRVTAESIEPFDPATIANADDILSAIPRDYPAPEVHLGYWPTIRLCWTKRAWEIEVFSDHVEVYLFQQQNTEIRHHAHLPGAQLSEGLLRDLAALIETSE